MSFLQILLPATTLLTLICLFSIYISKFTAKKFLHSPFECGFNPLSPSRLPFSLHFFFIAILFLIFDIEIILILPFPLMKMNTLVTFTSIFVTISILILGLMYEWFNNYLQWK